MIRLLGVAKVLQSEKNAVEILDAMDILTTEKLKNHDRNCLSQDHLTQILLPLRHRVTELFENFSPRLSDSVASKSATCR